MEEEEKKEEEEEDYRALVGDPLEVPMMSLPFPGEIGTGVILARKNQTSPPLPPLPPSPPLSTSHHGGPPPGGSLDSSDCTSS